MRKPLAAYLFPFSFPHHQGKLSAQFILCCKSNNLVSLTGCLIEKQTVTSQSTGSIILWKTVLVTGHRIYLLIYGCIAGLALVIPVFGS